MSKSELKKLGYGSSSKRFKLKGKKLSRENTISERQHSTMRLRERTGEAKITREQATKRLRKGNTPGGLSYSSEAQRQREIRKARGIRKILPGITDSDYKLVNKFYDVRKRGLTREEQNQFDALFNKYERDAVLEALGSEHIIVGFSPSALKVA